VPRTTESPPRMTGVGCEGVESSSVGPEGALLSAEAITSLQVVSYPRTWNTELLCAITWDGRSAQKRESGVAGGRGGCGMEIVRPSCWR
jgi:hypothetical protein